MNISSSNKFQFYPAEVLLRSQVDQHLAIDNFAGEVGSVLSLKMYLKIVETHILVHCITCDLYPVCVYFIL